jgi:hypothetical protein
MTKREFAARWQQLKDLDKHARMNPGGLIIMSFKSDEQILRYTKERMFLHFEQNRIADAHHIRGLECGLANLKTELAFAKGHIAALEGDNTVEIAVLADDLTKAHDRIAVLEGDYADVCRWFQHQQKVSLERYHRIKELEADIASVRAIANAELGEKDARIVELEKELTQLQVDSL